MPAQRRRTVCSLQVARPGCPWWFDDAEGQAARIISARAALGPMSVSAALSSDLNLFRTQRPFLPHDRHGVAVAADPFEHGGQVHPPQQAVLMAQAGSFRPPARVWIGTLDKMFSHGDGGRGVAALAGNACFGAGEGGYPGGGLHGGELGGPVTYASPRLRLRTSKAEGSSCDTRRSHRAIPTAKQTAGALNAAFRPSGPSAGTRAPSGPA